MEEHGFQWVNMDSIKNIFTKDKKKGKKSTTTTTSSKDTESEKTTTSSVDDVPVIEVSETKETGRVGQIEPIIVKSIDLSSVVDVQEVAGELKNGNIIILNISPLMDEDPNQLKKAVDRLKGLASDIGGDVGRLSESRIIATPELVQIQFRREP